MTPCKSRHRALEAIISASATPGWQVWWEGAPDVVRVVRIVQRPPGRVAAILIEEVQHVQNEALRGPPWRHPDTRSCQELNLGLIHVHAMLGGMCTGVRLHMPADAEPSGRRRIKHHRDHTISHHSLAPRRNIAIIFRCTWAMAAHTPACRSDR